MKKLTALFLFIQFLAHWGMAASPAERFHEFFSEDELFSEDGEYHEFFSEDIDWDDIQVLEMEEVDIPLDFYISESAFDAEQQEEERLALAPLVPLLAIISVGSAALGCAMGWKKARRGGDDGESVVVPGLLGGMSGAFLGVVGWVYAESFLIVGAVPSYGGPAVVPALFGAAGGILCRKVSKDGENQERPPSQP